MLAPMAGITDWAMRVLSEAHGCNAATTEIAIIAPFFLDFARFVECFAALAVDLTEPLPFFGSAFTCLLTAVLFEGL